MSISSLSPSPHVLGVDFRSHFERECAPIFMVRAAARSDLCLCFLLLFNRPITILNGLVCVPSANLKEVQNAEPEGNLCDYKLKMLSSV